MALYNSTVKYYKDGKVYYGQKLHNSNSFSPTEKVRIVILVKLLFSLGLCMSQEQLDQACMLWQHCLETLER